MKNLDGSAVKDVGVLSISKKHCRRIIYVHSEKHFWWNFLDISITRSCLFPLFIYFAHTRVHKLRDRHNIVILVQKSES